MLTCMEMGHRLEVPVLCICPSGSFPEVAADGETGEKGTSRWQEDATLRITRLLRSILNIRAFCHGSYNHSKVKCVFK